MKETLGLKIPMGVSLPSRPAEGGAHGQRPGFTAQPFVDWCAEYAVAMHYIQPGKPDQNA